MTFLEPILLTARHTLLGAWKCPIMTTRVYSGCKLQLTFCNHRGLENPRRPDAPWTRANIRGEPQHLTPQQRRSAPGSKKAFFERLVSSGSDQTPSIGKTCINAFQPWGWMPLNWNGRANNDKCYQKKCTSTAHHAYHTIRADSGDRCKPITLDY